MKGKQSSIGNEKHRANAWEREYNEMGKVNMVKWEYINSKLFEILPQTLLNVKAWSHIVQHVGEGPNRKAQVEEVPDRKDI